MAHTVKLDAQDGLVLPPAFWKRIGFRENEEFVVQGHMPVVTLIPKRMISAYRRQSELSNAKLRQLGLEDDRVWTKESAALRKTRARLNKKEYPELYA
ncbi:hypothetical protein A3B36_00210 [Candidatus Uhrbacteria bacterium RIFCSPLOWO2_01_FULL_55_36]|nr:MAG: hypothetical protein A3B36_00210 [Candidatus Uhrbacteria bacterium RIFCSPLOWO2_01_FULL_55_36]